MTESVNGMSFQQAKSLLDIDKAASKKAEANTEEIAIFDVDHDGQLNVAEQKALFAYRENQDKVPFDFDKDSKLDKAEQKAYEAYTIQRGEEKYAELVNNVAKAIARNEDGSLDTGLVKKFSSEELVEIADETAVYDDLRSQNEKKQIVKSALVLAEYNRAKGCECKPTPESAPEPTPAPTSAEEFLQHQVDPANFKVD